jgi:TRAP-type C4-dicarboxylate transport system permease small subunit
MIFSLAAENGSYRRLVSTGEDERGYSVIRDEVGVRHEELARYALIWIVFLGAGVGCRKGQLISLEFVVRALPRLPGQIAKHAGYLMCIGFFGLMVSVGVAFVELGRVETSPVMNLSKAWVYWAMPAGASLMILNTAAFMAEAVVTRADIRDMASAASTD